MNNVPYTGAVHFSRVITYPHPPQVTLLSPSGEYTFMLNAGGQIRTALGSTTNWLPLHKWYQVLDEISKIGKHYFGPTWGLDLAEVGLHMQILTLPEGTLAHERNARITDFVAATPGDTLSCGERMFQTMLAHPKVNPTVQTIEVKDRALPFFLNTRVYTWSALMLRS